MNDTKPWWQSKGIWGGIVAGLGVLLNIFGYEFGAEDQANLLAQIDNIMMAVGVLLGLWGRITAKAKVTSS